MTRPTVSSLGQEKHSCHPTASLYTTNWQIRPVVAGTYSQHDTMYHSDQINLFCFPLNANVEHGWNQWFLITAEAIIAVMHRMNEGERKLCFIRAAYGSISQNGKKSKQNTIFISVSTDLKFPPVGISLCQVLKYTTN